MNFQSMYDWICTVSNWPLITAGLYVADKVVKATPWKADDFVIDVVVGGIKKLLPGRAEDEQIN